MQAIFDAGVEAGSAKPKRNDATQTIFVADRRRPAFGNDIASGGSHTTRAWLFGRHDRATANFAPLASEAQQVWLLKRLPFGRRENWSKGVRHGKLHWFSNLAVGTIARLQETAHNIYSCSRSYTPSIPSLYLMVPSNKRGPDQILYSTNARRNPVQRKRSIK